MQYCTKCVTISSRSRLTFNDEGICAACQWTEAKRTNVDWKARWNKLEELCNKYRRNDGTNWDVLVPCSGGKDGSYVAWRLKHDFKMHPLCVTVLPQLQTEIGRRNLENFKKSGFDHITIAPNPKVYKRLAIKGFKEQGRPKLPFVTGITTISTKIAMKFNIPFVVYGEEGESEYGGAMTQAHIPRIDRNYLVNYYYSGHDTNEYLDEFTKDEMIWWLLPAQEEFQKRELFGTHWSHYEDWDPMLHAKLAREKCGLQTVEGVSEGTFTNYAQLDDVLQDLHAYMMFIKFAFGRATSDAAIEIRAGRMSREEGVKLIKKLDGIFPEKYLQDFLNYFEMTEEKFWNVIDSFANRELLEKIENRWRLKPLVVEALEKGGKFELHEVTK
jgi:N-acetyl sugar amidotransferase